MVTSLTITTIHASISKFINVKPFNYCKTFKKFLYVTRYDYTYFFLIWENFWSSGSWEEYFLRHTSYFQCVIIISLLKRVLPCICPLETLHHGTFPDQNFAHCLFLASSSSSLSFSSNSKNHFQPNLAQSIFVGRDSKLLKY